MTWQTITSRRNPLLLQVKELLNNGAERDKQKEFVCDGDKLLEEAIRWKAPVSVLISSKPESISQVPDGTRLISVPPEVMESISPMKTPQGTLLVCKIPENPLPDKLQGERYLLLDGVQDPGNVGSAWRSADAFDCSGLLLTGNCADPFSAKTARATMGAIFRMPVWKVNKEEVALLSHNSSLPVIGALLSDNTINVQECDLSRGILVVGSEGKGISKEIQALCNKTIKIPMSSHCESLNAAMAATLLLWEGYRTQQKD